MVVVNESSSVSLEVHSVAGALPNAGSGEDRLHILGAVPQNGTTPAAEPYRESSHALAIDAGERNVVWDAEIQLNAPNSEMVENLGLLGERMENGEIETISRTILGQKKPLILHVDDMVSLSDLQYHGHSDLACSGTNCVK